MRESLEDPEKDVGNPKDRKSHSQVSLKEERFVRCPWVQNLVKELRDLGQARGHAVRRINIKALGP